MLNYPAILRKQTGFTLIEAMIALVVLTVGVLSLQRMQLTTIQGNATAQSLTLASSWSADRAERLTGLDYTDPLLVDTDGDGAGGLDDTVNLGNVAADFLFTLDAAGNEVVTQSGNAIPVNSGQFNIYWNVDDGAVVPNTKTIRVITTWNDLGQQKNTVVNHVKASSF